MTDAGAIDRAAAIAAISDPATTGETLASVAAYHPDLRPHVLAHPACYDGLREWIAAVEAANAQAVAVAAASPTAVATVTAPAAIPVVAPGGVAPKGKKGGPGRKRRRAIIASSIAGGLVILLGSGAFAAYTFVFGNTGGSMDSAEALPASTILMVEVSLEPSNEQKLRVVQMYNRIDGVMDYLDTIPTGVNAPDELETDVRPQIWEALIDSDRFDTDLDYDDDIKPWIGSRFSFAIVPGDTVEESTLYAIESKDDDKGVKAIEQLIDDIGAGDLGDDVVVEARDGYIFIHSDELDLDEQFDDGVLADKPGVAEMADALGDRGLVSYYSDARGYSELQSIETGGYLGDSDYLNQAEDDLPEDAASAGIVRLLDNGVEFLQVTRTGIEGATLDGNGGAVEVMAELPASTAAAGSVQGLGTMLDWVFSPEAFAQLAVVSGGSTFAGGWDYDEDLDAFLQGRDEIEDALEMNIPDEMDALVGDGLGFAVDSDLGCDFDDLAYGPCEDFRVGFIARTDDADALRNKLEDTVDELSDDSGMDVNLEFSDDESAAAVSFGDYAAELVSEQDDKLGSAPGFKSALPDRDEAIMASFVSVDGLMAILEDADVDMEPEVEAAIRDFSAFGQTITVDDEGMFTTRTRIILS